MILEYLLDAERHTKPIFADIIIMHDGKIAGRTSDIAPWLYINYDENTPFTYYTFMEELLEYCDKTKFSHKERRLLLEFVRCMKLDSLSYQDIADIIV